MTATEPTPTTDLDPRPLLTDQYELTMLRAYHDAGMDAEATFSLFYRTLPEHRNVLLACGLHDVLRYLEALRFSGEALDHLARRGEFSDDFVAALADLRFTGEVRALPEGTPVFPNEPILEVTAPIAEAQLVESYVMNQVHLQTVLASKARRVVAAAGDRAVVDFGLRRMHGSDAALKGARAFYVGGAAATSNVLAGREYGVPVTGTMAHSFVQAHDSEEEAFRHFVSTYPETVLLIDTYDTVEGARKVVQLAHEMGDDFRVRAVRLDSGDLGELAHRVRGVLDDAGLDEVEIFASGGLDEWEIRRLLDDENAPIDGFGVGTRMGASEDAPTLDMAYKLTAYAGEGRLKLSSGKETLPGRKQIWRIEEDGVAARDVIAREEEDPPEAGPAAGRARPLLETVMRGGRRVDTDGTDLEAARRRARDQVAKLPDHIRALDPTGSPYPVEVSDALDRHRREVVERVRRKVAS